MHYKEKLIAAVLAVAFTSAMVWIGYVILVEFVGIINAFNNSF